MRHLRRPFLTMAKKTADKSLPSERLEKAVALTAPGFEGGELFKVPKTPELLSRRRGEGLFVFVLLACTLSWLAS